MITIELTQDVFFGADADGEPMFVLIAKSRLPVTGETDENFTAYVEAGGKHLGLLDHEFVVIK
jgi:hypothetical protein